LPGGVRDRWIWWNLPEPSPYTATLAGLLEEQPLGVGWHSAAQTRYILGLMSERNRQKVKAAQATGIRTAGTIYRRTRNGSQRAEVRFDGISGCLRTPAGGSSRQTILVTEGRKVRSRLLSPREASRLMGVPEDYPIPVNCNQAYHLFGDGLAVPVVRYLAENLLEPLASARRADRCSEAQSYG
jgi:DNA (cytosine-5)-methyltransferase 1